MGNCLNARNLPRGGLSFARGLACHLPAVALVYGATDQLDGMLDVLTRQVLAVRATPTKLAARFATLSAQADDTETAAAAGALPFPDKKQTDRTQYLRWGPRPNEMPVAQIRSFSGLIVKLEGSASWSQRPIDRGFMVFPRFVAGAQLS